MSMKDIRAMTLGDIEWAVEVLARRRGQLVPYAPLYWRPAADAVERHRAYLAYLIGEDRGLGFRSDDALMIAASGPHGWTIDDAWVQPDRWEHEGHALWTKTAAETGGNLVRFVCPVFEPERASFARQQGFVLDNSWWHAAIDVPDTIGVSEKVPRVTGSRAALVPAPPVYDPGGPILFLQDVRDPTAITRSREEAVRCGSPLVVVDQPTGANDLARALAESGFTRHCDFLVGPV